MDVSSDSKWSPQSATWIIRCLHEDCLKTPTVCVTQLASKTTAIDSAQALVLAPVVLQAAGVGRVVELTLVHEVRAACVVAEDFVGQVEAGGYSGEALVEAVTQLSVQLEVASVYTSPLGPLGPRLLGSVLSVPAAGAGNVDGST